MANVLLEYIRSAQLTGSKDAYFVLTCGSEIGNAGQYAAQLCEELELNCKGVLEVVMPENYIEFYVKADAFFATHACIGCGACVEVCPLNNIHLNDGKPVWDKHCTHCMACICGCPTEAIEYGKRSKGKPRYRCPKDETL